MRQKVLLIFLAVLFLSFFFFKPKFSATDSLSVITKARAKSNWVNFTDKKLLKGKPVSAEFKADMNNLGIVAVRFNTFDRVNDGSLVFKLKEDGAKDWYYQNTYKVDQFQDGDLFPFGFPPIANSEGKNYVFTLESTSTDSADAVALNQAEQTFVSRYQFSKAAFLSNKSDIFKFPLKKISSVIDPTQFGTQALVSVFITILILLLYSSKFEQFLNKNPRLVNVFIVVVSVGIALYLVGENLKARFGLIDDHWIMYFLGPDQKVKLTEIPRLIMSTEVGQFGSYQRFRPTYNSLLVIESFLWGNNPFLWYFVRLVMTFAAIAILWYLIVPVIGVVVGLLFTLSILTYPFWADIWTRLGPGEIYAVFGTALYALGFVSLLKKFKGNKGNILLFMGFILAAGSKENFLILLMPTIYLMFKYRKLILNNKLGSVLLLIQLIYGAAIASAIIIAISKSGHDVYLNQTGPTSRLALFQAGLTLFISRLKLLYFIIFAAAIGIITYIKKNKAQFWKFLRMTIQYSKVFVALGLMFISQYVFYSGNWPTNIRYDFPGILVVPFGWLAGSLFIFESLKFIFPKLSKKDLLAFLITTIFFLVWSRGFSQIRQTSLLNQSRTNEFKRHFDNIVATARKNSEKPLVFESYNISDYEAIFSLQRYLRIYNINIPMYLRLHDYPKDTKVDSLEKQLVIELTKYSAKGGNFGSVFKPLNQLETSTYCLSVVFFVKRTDRNLCNLVRVL